MIEIVPEIPAQHADAIEALYDRTFGPGHFAKTAERLREGSARVTHCCQVALQSDQVVGACRIWPIVIGETKAPAVFVGPLAVAKDHRGKTLGQDLTRAALKASKQDGWPLALIVGSPAYFTPIGFQMAPTGMIQLPGPQDASRILFLPLQEGAELPAGGVQTAPPPRILV